MDSLNDHSDAPGDEDAAYLQQRIRGCWAPFHRPESPRTSQMLRVYRNRHPCQAIRVDHHFRVDCGDSVQQLTSLILVIFDGQSQKSDWHSVRFPRREERQWPDRRSATGHLDRVEANDRPLRSKMISLARMNRGSVALKSQNCHPMASD